MSYSEQLDSKMLRFKNGLGKLKTRISNYLSSKEMTEEKKKALEWIANL